MYIYNCLDGNKTPHLSRETHIDYATHNAKQKLCNLKINFGGMLSVLVVQNINVLVIGVYIVPLRRLLYSATPRSR